MLTRLAEPGAGIDVIVIEASGLAEPQNIVRMLLYSENPGIVYGGLVEVVDAAELTATRAVHPELDKHLRFADLVVLNKADRVSTDALAEVRAVVDSLAGGTPVLPVVHGAVDPALLFDTVAVAEDGPRQLSLDELLLDADDHSQHAHARYTSVPFSTRQPMHPRRFAAFLDERPEGLYRMKGHVYFGVPEYTGRFGLHTVGSYLRFTWSAWPRGMARGTELVMIGTELDSAMLTRHLESCLREDGEELDENAMLPVLRHTE